jgi:hypothetical protein
MEMIESSVLHLLADHPEPAGCKPMDSEPARRGEP